MRSGSWARSVTVAVALLAATVTAGCTAGPVGPTPHSSGDVVSQLGRVPIPSVSQDTPAPLAASIGHPQLLAMGAPVEASLPGGVRALISTAGPTEDLPPGGAKPGSKVHGQITVTVTPSAGTVRLAAADLACRDQTGALVALRPIGPAGVTASPGHPASLVLAGTFRDGDAQLNWRQDGRAIAIWDFTIEID